MTVRPLDAKVVLKLLRIFMWFLVAFASGCERRGPPPYGREFNSRRAERGIPVIPDNWKPTDIGRQVDWVNPTFTGTNGPLHASKTVCLTRDGQLDYEYDIYYSGRSFPDAADPGRMSREFMQLKYSYADERAGRKPWDCSVSAGGAGRGDHGEYSLEQADAILKRWGLTRR